MQRRFQDAGQIAAFEIARRLAAQVRVQVIAARPFQSSGNHDAGEEGEEDAGEGEGLALGALPGKVADGRCFAFKRGRFRRGWRHLGREQGRNVLADDDFEARLKAELPRGLTPQKSLGRERALSARWLGAEEMTGETWEYGRNGLLLGRRKGGLIGWDDDRHVLTVAGSRAGKGVSLIVPNLIFYEGSAFVIDPKGENAAITAGRRGKGTRKGGAGLGQDVYVLDPFDVSGRERRGRPVSFNPLAELDLDGEDVVEDASMFAEALITHPEKDRHWTESAQALLRALILVALADRDPRRRNLITVRRLLTLTDRRIRDVQHHFSLNSKRRSIRKRR